MRPWCRIDLMTMNLSNWGFSAARNTAALPTAIERPTNRDTQFAKITPTIALWRSRPSRTSPSRFLLLNQTLISTLNSLYFLRGVIVQLVTLPRVSRHALQIFIWWAHRDDAAALPSKASWEISSTYYITTTPVVIVTITHRAKI